MSKDVRAGNAFIQLSIRGGAKLKQSMMKIGGSVATAFKGMSTNTNAFAVKARDALGSALKHFVEFGDQMHKMSMRTGIAVDDLSMLKFALEQSGTSVEALADGMKDFLRNTKDVGGAPIEKLMAAADEISSIEDSGQQAARAMELFGEKGYEMLPFLQEGSEGIKKLTAEADKLGATLSQDQADKAAQLADTWNKLKTFMGGVLVEIGSQLAPFATKFVEAGLEIAMSWKVIWIEMEMAVRSYINTATKMYADYSDTVGDMTMKVLNSVAKAVGNEAWIEATSVGMSGGNNERRRRQQEELAYLNKRNDLMAARDKAAADAASRLQGLHPDYGVTDTGTPEFGIASGSGGIQLPSKSSGAARSAAGALSTGGFGGMMTRQAGKVAQQIRIAEQQLDVEEKTLAAVEKLQLSFG